MDYNPFDWYWIVQDKPADQRWSSKRKKYVNFMDDLYLAWVRGGNKATIIKNHAELMEVLAAYPGLLPESGDDAAQKAKVDKILADPVGSLILNIMKAQDDRVRIIEKKATLTKDQFLTALKDLV